jgi:hypothetical protein
MPGVCQPALLYEPEKGKPLDLRIDSYYLPVSVFEEIAFAQGLAAV